MLAYAAQGLAGDAGSQPAAQLREFLAARDAALIGLADAVPRRGRTRTRLEPADRYHAFLAVLDRDARDALAAVQLVHRPALDQLAAGRQPERVDPPARAADRSVSDRRDPEGAAICGRPADSRG